MSPMIPDQFREDYDPPPPDDPGEYDEEEQGPPCGRGRCRPEGCWAADCWADTGYEE